MNTNKYILYLSLITFLLSLPCSSSVAQDEAEKKVFGEFYLEGGTTSDSIVISNVKYSTDFEKMSDERSIQVKNKKTNPKLSFSVDVPKGKEASLTYDLFLRLSSMSADGIIANGSSVNFTVKIDKDIVITHTNTTCISYKSEEITIPSGKHVIQLISRFSAKNCNYVGTIKDLGIHVHSFGELELVSEPLCGEKGESTSTCKICGKNKTIYANPAYDEHKWSLYSGNRSGCMSSADSIFVCERCPKVEIHRSGAVNDHDFDGDVCKVCGQRIPKYNVQRKAYEITSAKEMLLLSELLSRGRLPSDIGIELMADMEFSKDTPMLPLGTYDHPFQGVINGNGHRIRGIVNSYQGIDCLGFVGVAKGTLLSHVIISNLIFDRGNSLRGQACVGGIVGYAKNCDIVNCASFGTLEGTDNVGGIVGYADQQVSLLNCASVTTIRAQGIWNTMACGMPHGHILNSYGVAKNNYGGTFDELPTTTLRHCFSSQGNAEGLEQVSENVLSSYAMVELLNEECESPCFTMSDTYHYPVPLVNSTILSRANRPMRKARKTISEFSAPTVVSANNEPVETHEKERGDVEVINGYVNKAAALQAGQTIEEVIRKDSTLYANFYRVYVTTNSAPEGFKLYNQISGGNLLAFESFIIPADSSYIRMTDYQVVSEDKVKAKTETVNYNSDGNERIDQYTIEEGDNYSLTARITFENDYDILYQENIDGLMKTVWSIKTERDATLPNMATTNVYSHDQNTGETHLEYSYTYNIDNDAEQEDDSYIEYIDSETNTIHVIYSYSDPADETTIYRDHYTLRASDQYLMEVRTEKIIDGVPYPTDGIYFLYDDEGGILQSVVYGPVDDNKPDSDLRPYMYYEYTGFYQATPYPTTIKVPTTQQPTMQKRMDPNIYDMQGRVVSRVTDTKDPFSGLPRGLYIYQGTKYLKRK